MMIDQDRNALGWFARKGSSERKIRSIRLTDETWNFLGEKADDNDMTKADFLEAIAAGEIKWNEDDETKSDVDFDIDEVAEILRAALSFKGNATKKIKLEIRKVLELMDIEIDDSDNDS